MTTLRAAAQQALEALDTLYRTLTPETSLAKSLKQRADDLRAALAEAVEPVAWRWRMRNPTDLPGFAQPWNVSTYYPREQANEIEPLYAAPPQRKPLSDEEISKVAAPFYGVLGFRVEAFARAIEAAHGIKEKT